MYVRHLVWRLAPAGALNVGALLLTVTDVVSPAFPEWERGNQGGTREAGRAVPPAFKKASLFFSLLFCNSFWFLGSRVAVTITTKQNKTQKEKKKTKRNKNLGEGRVTQFPSLRLITECR